MLLGGIRHGFLTLMMTMGMRIKWAGLSAVVIVGIIGIQWSRWLSAHPKVFMAAGVIPMFPGIYVDTAMLLLVKTSPFGYGEVLFATLGMNFLKAWFIVAALYYRAYFARSMVVPRIIRCI